MYAVFPSAGSRPIFPELLAEGLEPHVVEKLYLTLTANPTDVVDITSVFARKRAALGSHASQLGEEVLEMVAEWDTERGKVHGFEYAEEFRVVNFR